MNRKQIIILLAGILIICYSTYRIGRLQEQKKCKAYNEMNRLMDKLTKMQEERERNEWEMYDEKKVYEWGEIDEWEMSEQELDEWELGR